MLTRAGQDTLETLFLDAGGVLLHPNWERASRALERQGVSVSARALEAAEPYAKRVLDDPEWVARTDDDSRGRSYFDLVLEQAGVGLSRATRAAVDELREYHTRHNIWERVPEEVPGVLRRFRRSGLRLVVVSNANGRLESSLARLGLLELFDHVLDSHVLGVEKPDPRLFEFALERSGAQPESTVHVGDLYHIDVVGARAAGLGAVLLDSHDLSADRDCPRVASLTELANLLLDGAATRPAPAAQ